LHLPDRALGFGRAAFTGATGDAGSVLPCQQGMAAAQPGLLPAAWGEGSRSHGEGNRE